MSLAANWLLGVTLQWLASLAVAAPFVLLASLNLRGKKMPWLLPVGLALFFWASLALAQSERAAQILRSPWQGMSLELALALAVIVLAGRAREAGLTLRVADGTAWRDSLIATALLIAFIFTRSTGLRWLGLSTAETQSPGWEYLLFQATLPGLAEEPVYRGVIQSGLNRWAGRPWKLFGASLGWGWVITTLLFWAIHAFRPVEGGGLSFYWPTLTMQLWAGAVFGWVRERSGSLIPAILCHNLANLAWTLL